MNESYFSQNTTKRRGGWGCGSVVEHMLRIVQVQGSISSTKKIKIKNKNK
jgi:hypothetical protein